MNSTPPSSGAEWIGGDVTSRDDCARAVEGMQCVMHLAAIPGPLAGREDETLRVNTVGTFCILQTAASAGVSHAILASSDSVLGFVFRARDYAPLYVPIDEDHPFRAQDGYSLSKIFTEEIGRSFSDRTGLRVTCLRPCHIMFPQDAAGWRCLTTTPEGGWRKLWVYVHAADVAHAFRLAAEQPPSAEAPFEAMFVVAPDIAGDFDTADLLRRFYPSVAVPSELVGRGNWSPISSARAQKRLGWACQHSWREMLAEGAGI